MKGGMRLKNAVRAHQHAHAPFSRNGFRRHKADHDVMACAHRVCSLPGDGIGPEIMKVAVDLLQAAGQAEGVEFELSEHLIGGAAIEAHDDPYPRETDAACKASDAVLLAAIGGCV